MQTATQPATLEKLNPPSTIGEWRLDQIIATLSRPLPNSLLSQRKQGKVMLTYIPWHEANRILDKYAPGWTWQIMQTHLSSDRIFVVGRLTITTQEGTVYRDATGTEELKEMDSKTGEIRELTYGDPSSNAESMAFRRAAARFGLGLYLYNR
jgi:Protein of unknown function (DUF1071)